jgi:tRNA modification GTPase
MLKDTIIAAATPPGRGGIGIVRLSGQESLRIASRLFRPGRGELSRIKPRTAVFGRLRDGAGRDDLDEAILTYYTAPRSFTREDVVEIACHGSPVIIAEAVRMGIAAGARQAGPGEFTLRAYLNGRLDLIQAEAVDSLIRAVTLAEARVAARQVGGSLSRRVASLRGGLISLLADLEAGIEFPDENVGLTPAEKEAAVRGVLGQVEELVRSHDAGRAMAEGLTLAVMGRTNVGKSTLFNALLGEARAIVTPFPGTTRDYLRETTVIRGLVVNLVDMAGIGRPRHPVETEGIARGRRLADEADGLLLLLDASRRLGREDVGLMKKYRGRKAILVLNKTDLPAKIDRAEIRAAWGRKTTVSVSALKGTNIDRLKNAIYGFFKAERSENDEILLRGRQKALLEEIGTALRKSAEFLEAGQSDELCAEEIRSALPSLARLSGEVRAGDVMEAVFSRFCVGK